MIRKKKNKMIFTPYQIWLCSLSRQLHGYCSIFFFVQKVSLLFWSFFFCLSLAESKNVYVGPIHHFFCRCKIHKLNISFFFFRLFKFLVNLILRKKKKSKFSIWVCVCSLSLLSLSPSWLNTIHIYIFPSLSFSFQNCLSLFPSLSLNPVYSLDFAAHGTKYNAPNMLCEKKKRVFK